MNKKLCITTFVFGEGFQEYIPLYIYSALKSYSDCYPMIFLHGSLSKTVRGLLETLKGLGEFEVVENYLAGEKLNNQQGKAVRWILDDPRFDEFDAVYIGDIDIILVPEEPGLYEQHIQHCKVLGLPYSNAVRPLKNLTTAQKIRKAAEAYAELGGLSAIRFLLRHGQPVRRLSGLHFIKTADYFERIRPLIPKYTKLITDNSFKSREKTVHHEKGFNNESLLYDMMAEAGMELQSDAEYSLDYRDYNKTAFRPHHGLHLGIFRTDKTVIDCCAILDTDVYKEYYQKFRIMTEGDAVFCKLMDGLSMPIQQQLQRIHQYYG
jgi:hypothetical protein